MFMVVPAKALLDAHIFWWAGSVDKNGESFQWLLSDRHQDRSKTGGI
jgi:hypothetical protein